VSAPDTEDGLGRAQQAAARALAAGACLVAVAGGTPLTRRLVCETARLEQGAVTLLVEDGSEDSVFEGSVFEDRARTAVLSGRTDLVGRRL
jgi:anthraniloyl-CoA monooxygenase